ncbi:flagellar hook-associated protein FlgK [Butyrivibrio sp. INlla16]|uniref:flagellar hook-associated protein FlgK n=1 Tax=Butyrivibrio sp. INlla16 TaxID=1520807 RepID=UPI00088CA3BA|nr:flagellar hook-associated protein FlgK [Butyrivibrio sp. INlla16]SDB68941.1 flagellar hook-associated protein 1 FlgK [Butyrivibrio sp. INlla16]
MASLMGSLYIGASGLQTSSNALNTTAHNMSNIDTEGYTRQQVSQGTRPYITTEKDFRIISWKQTGLGVVYNNCKQVRSLFLDQSYRQESGRQAFYDVSVTTLEEIEDQLQEMNGNEFADSLSNLWVAVQEMSKNPTSAVNQSTLVTRANEFITRANSVYEGLTNYQDNMDLKVADLVEQINKIGDRIKELNLQIVEIESGNQEHANDLRDERNLLLDQLGELGRISYYEDIFGNVLVQFEGTQFVTTDHVNHMACDNTLPADKGGSPSGYNTPYWEFAAKKEYDPILEEWVVTDIRGAKVFDLTQTVSTAMNTDIGKLRSTLLARGDHHANYHDITDDPTGAYYNTNIAQSVIMNVEAEFDQMIKNICTAINQVYEDAGSNPVTLGEVEGRTSDYDLFKVLNEEDCLNYDIDENHKAGENKKGYIITNIAVNPLYMAEPTAMKFLLADGSEDNDTVEKLKGAFTTAKYLINPNVATKTDFVGYYNMLVSQVANSGDVYKGIKSNQELTVSAVSNAREQIVGVSSDEELEFMVKFQNAFNASSRYINVVSAMLEHVVTALGS